MTTPPPSFLFLEGPSSSDSLLLSLRSMKDTGGLSRTMSFREDDETAASCFTRASMACERRKHRLPTQTKHSQLPRMIDDPQKSPEQKEGKKDDEESAADGRRGMRLEDSCERRKGGGLNLKCSFEESKLIANRNSGAPGSRIAVQRQVRKQDRKRRLYGRAQDGNGTSRR